MWTTFTGTLCTFPQAALCCGQQSIQEPKSTTPTLFQRCTQFTANTGRTQALSQACTMWSWAGGGHGPGHAYAWSTTQGKVAGLLLIMKILNKENWLPRTLTS